MNFAVLLDFGSTYTKVVCVDLNARRVVLSDKYPSTVHEDAGIALNKCLSAAESVLGKENLKDALKLSTSSAAGGLRIAVCGLTESLSMKAGRNASFGAGGKVVQTCTGRLTESDLAAVLAADAEILLLCGGYEGGNSALVLENAKLIRESMLHIPVIYAGNSEAAKTVRRMFQSRGKECFLAENMIPDIGKLNIDSAVSIIRDLFMSRITNMKGVGVVKKVVDGPIVPTPASVLAAGELLCRGTEREEGIGPYMLADIGGATTDIYSFAENESYSGAKKVGAPEPFAKRTVEGDMGMRESSSCLMQEVGAKIFARKCGMSVLEVEEAIEKRTKVREYVADSEAERKIDLEIAANAVGISARRHAGTCTKEFYGGCNLVQRGKNLSEIRKIIGTGGILVNNGKAAAEKILKNAELCEKEKNTVLLPERLETLVDEDYIFFAAGLLRAYDEDTALAIMKESIGRK
ncbi:glutamate mutase L [Anaerovoracaceae bacterium 41-7]